jgi:hypothetical protein
VGIVFINGLLLVQLLSKD